MLENLVTEDGSSTSLPGGDVIVASVVVRLCGATVGMLPWRHVSVGGPPIDVSTVKGNGNVIR